MTTFYRFNKAGALCLLLFVSACTTYQAPGPAPAPTERVPATPTPTVPHTPTGPSERAVEPSSSAAYRPLLAKAEQCAARGDYEQALALLERAQRIDPDNAEIYLGMARTHDARGDLAQARATAERGMLYCINNSQCAALRIYLR